MTLIANVLKGLSQPIKLGQFEIFRGVADLADSLKPLCFILSVHFMIFRVTLRSKTKL